MIGPDDILPAQPSPIVRKSDGYHMDLRVCRSKSRQAKDEILRYRKETDEVRRFSFPTQPDQHYKLSIAIDADRKLTVTCLGSDGTSATQSLFDHLQ